MTPTTRSWLKTIGLTAGLLALGGTVFHFGRRRRPWLSTPPVPPPPDPPEQVFGFEIIPPLLPDPEDGPQSGEIVRDMSGGLDGGSIDERDIFLGPILPAIPEGKILTVDFEIITESQPPAIPGASASPCYGFALYLEVDSALQIVREKQTWPQECERLQKNWGGDYDVSFPNVRLVMRADGVYLRYTWIRFRHPQNGNIYMARDYTVALRWQLV